jgi:mono/diheme cytochrome c family protein
LDPATGTELASITVGREPIAAAMTRDGRILLVANHLPDSRTDVEYRGRVSAVVWAIETRTLESTAIPLPNGASSVRSMCISPDGSYALVTHVLSNFQNVPFRVDMGWVNVNVVSMIDVRKRDLIGTIGLDELQLGAANPWGVAFSRDGSKICVAASGTHELCVIDTFQLLSDRARRTMSPLPGAWPVYPSLGDSLWRRIALPGRGPRGVAIVGSTAYVAQYYSDTLAVVALDESANAVPRTIALGPPPNWTRQRRGQMLFDDATICYQSWQSCASCHPDARSDGLNWDLMNDGIGNPKSTKSMLLAHVTPPAMAQGVRETAEGAVRSGITNILFMHRPEEEAAAIDVYLKTLEPVPSPYLVGGQLSEAAQRGRLLFESDRIGCHRCHPAPLYTDRKTHRIGKAQSRRFNNQFDTPTLVEVWRTAPYLNQGRYPTIRELLIDGRHGLGGAENEQLNEQDVRDLVEFVLSL